MKTRRLYFCRTSFCHLILTVLVSAANSLIAATELNKQTRFAILGEGIVPCFTRLDPNKDSSLDLAGFTTHAGHKLTTLESGQPKTKRSKTKSLNKSNP